MAGASTLKVRVIVSPWPVAVSVTGVATSTGAKATVKVATSLPAGTVTLAGTDAAGLLLLSDTTAPPAGAGPVRSTRPVVVSISGCTMKPSWGVQSREKRTNAGGGSTAFCQSGSLGGPGLSKAGFPLAIVLPDPSGFMV